MRRNAAVVAGVVLVLIVAIVVAVVVKGPRPRGSRGEAPVAPVAGGPAVQPLDLGLPEGAVTAWVCVQRASVYTQPSPIGAPELPPETEVLPFGTEVSVEERADDWVHVRTEEPAAEGWVGLPLLCGDEAVIDAMRDSGIIPSCVFTLEAGESGEGLTSRLLAGDARARFSDADMRDASTRPRGADGQVDASGLSPEIVLSRGDFVWFADADAAESQPEFPFEGFGITTPLKSPTARVPYAYDGLGELLPLGELLARAAASPGQAAPGEVLAFAASPMDVPAPRDAYYHHELGFVIADAERGLVFIEPHPLQGAVVAKVASRPGSSARTIGLAGKMICATWAGASNELTTYTDFTTPKPEPDAVVQLPRAPLSFQGSDKDDDASIAYIGTEDGHLLAVSLDSAEVLSDTALSSEPVLQVALDGRRLYAACGEGGLVAVDVGDADAPGAPEVLADLGPVDAVCTVSLDAEAETLIAGPDTGWRRLTGGASETPAAEAVPGAEALHVRVAEISGPSTGTVMSGGASTDHLTIAGAGADGIHVYLGATAGALHASHQIAIPCLAMAWGSQFLASVGPDALWFVSLSEVLPEGHERSQFSVHAGAIAGFAGGGISFQDADCHGYIAMDPAGSLRELGEWGTGGGTPNMLTLADRSGQVMVIGDFKLMGSDLGLLSAGTIATIGKGGLTIGGEHYEAGVVLELAAEGTAQPIGRLRH